MSKNIWHFHNHAAPSFDMARNIKVICTLWICVGLFGCKATSETPLLDSKAQEAEQLSVASAQKLKVGDSATDVIKVLGSPNIITKSKSGNESWVYDRVAEHYELIQSDAREGFLFYKSSQTIRTASATKTFIVVVDFNQNNLVSNIAYRFTQ